MAADQGIIDSVSNSNIKTVAESAASVKMIQTVTPEQAQDDSTLQSGGLSQLIAALTSALAAAQISSKTGDNTPPMTGTQVPGK